MIRPSPMHHLHHGLDVQNFVGGGTVRPVNNCADGVRVTSQSKGIAGKLKMKVTTFEASWNGQFHELRCLGMKILKKTIE